MTGTAIITNELGTHFIDFTLNSSAFYFEAQLMTFDFRNGSTLSL